jgi:hypothetical protein
MKRSRVLEGGIVAISTLMALSSVGAHAVRSAHGRGMHLRPGVYIDASAPCNQPSASVVTNYDGRVFAGERYTASPTGRPGIFRMQYYEQDSGPPETWNVHITAIGSTAFIWTARGSSHRSRLCPHTSWP